MKKISILEKMISLAFAALLAFSFAACSDKSGGSGTDAAERPRDLNTVHAFSVSDGSTELVKNGASEFTIVYPSGAIGSDLTLAVSELKFFFREATGITLTAADDTTVTRADRILSIGATAQFNASAAAKSKAEAHDLAAQGYIVKTDGSSVYMYGKKDIGSLNAVYGFLSAQFGYSYYALDTYTIDRGVNDATLKNISITDIPDIPIRISGNGDTLSGIAHVRRMRFSNYSDAYVTDGIGFVHNYLHFFPKKDYMGKHPDWYSSDGTQLCLSRDPAGLRAALVEKIKTKFLANPQTDAISFTQMDGGTWCQCSACQSEYGLYDDDRAADVATNMRFMNAVAEDIKAWNETVCPERDLLLLVFCYGRQYTPPVKLDDTKKPVVNADGSYIPYSDELVFEDNIGVIYCGFGTAYYGVNGDDGQTRALFKRWQAVADKFYTWDYATYFGDYLLPNNTLESRQAQYRFVYENGTLAHFENSQYGTATSTDWGALKSFIESRLQWDVQLNVQTLIDDFMINYFGEAAAPMREMLSAYRGYTAYLAAERGVTGDSSMAWAVKSRENFPIKKIDEMLGYIDAAYAAIEPLKTANPARHETLYKRVLTESIAYRKLKIDLYPEMYSVTALNSEKKLMNEQCLYVGIIEGAENSSIGNAFI